MYKTILVHVDQTDRAVERIDLAASLALLHDAHLIGTATTGLSPYYFPVAGLDPSLPVGLAIDDIRADAQRALDTFEARVRKAGVNSFERRLIDDEAGLGVSMQAHYCDLVVVGQSAPGERTPRLRADFPEYVLLNSARPVLIVPAAGIKGSFGKRVMVAWNGSGDAVRALTSALPLLQRAVHVDVVVLDAEIEGDLHGAVPGADIALYLARHGVRVEVTAAGSGAGPGEALLTHAASNGSDLIVMGAYGHSRFREILLGGVTRTALRLSTLPLWMAH